MRAALLARRATARKLHLRSADSGVLGRGNATLDAGADATLVVRLGRREAGRLRELRHAAVKLSVVLRASDGRTAATAVPLDL